MSSGTIFEYRHKKFDQRKRSREDDSFSSENGTNSSILDLSDSSKASILSVVLSKPKKQKRVIKTMEQVVTPHHSNLFEQADVELRQRLQLIDLQYITPISVPSMNGGAIPTASSDDNVCIKKELIESNEIATSSESSLLSKRRRKPQFETPIKVEPQSSSANIKQELFELNIHLPAIPREKYEDICKFRSNMVRKFPKKERTIKEQERRNKNTFACRKSRRVKKIQHVAVEEEYKKYKNVNLQIAEFAIRSAVYFKEVQKLITEATDSEVIVVD